MNRQLQPCRSRRLRQSRRSRLRRKSRRSLSSKNQHQACRHRSKPLHNQLPPPSHHSQRPGLLLQHPLTVSLLQPHPPQHHPMPHKHVRLHQAASHRHNHPTLRPRRQHRQHHLGLHLPPHRQLHVRSHQRVATKEMSGRPSAAAIIDSNQSRRIRSSRKDRRVEATSRTFMMLSTQVSSGRT